MACTPLSAGCPQMVLSMAVLFACSTCGSPAVDVPREFVDSAPVHCRRCGQQVGTWGGFRERTKTLIRTGLSARSPMRLQIFALVPKGFIGWMAGAFVLRERAAPASSGLSAPDVRAEERYYNLTGGEKNYNGTPKFRD